MRVLVLRDWRRFCRSVAKKQDEWVLVRRYSCEDEPERDGDGTSDGLEDSMGVSDGSCGRTTDEFRGKSARGLPESKQDSALGTL